MPCRHLAATARHALGHRCAWALAPVLWAAATLPLPAAAQAPAGVTLPCQVRASGVMLSPGNYILKYQGACRNGFAQGEGRARWHYANSPDTPPVVWQGRFDNGILLTPQAVTAARPRDSHNMLLDLGRMEEGAGHLWVESSMDGKLPADGCRPRALHVLVDERAELASEPQARHWLQAAYRHWLRACPSGHASPQQPGLPPAQARLQIYRGLALTPDANGNLPRSTVSASASLQGQELVLQNYSNQAAAAQQQKARVQEQAQAYEANEKRLQALARQYGASRVVELQALDKNPFRFDGQVLLVPIRPIRVLSRDSATVRAATRDGWSYTAALAEGSDVASWDEDSRMLAVKVKGRSSEERTQDRVILQVLGSQACAAGDCQDYLLHGGGKWAYDKAWP